MVDHWPQSLSRTQLLAACILAVSNLAAFSLSPSPLGGMAVLFAFVLAWLLILGSRVGWTLALLGSAVGLVSPASHTPGILGANAFTIVCLLAPSSIVYTWKTPPSVASISIVIRPRIKSLVERVVEIGYGLVAQAAGWADSEGSQRSYSLLAWRLGGLALFLLFPLTLAYRWEQASHCLLADGLAKVTWIGWALVVMAFAVTLALSARQSVQTRRQRHGK
jgi:hypothetical protein